MENDYVELVNIRKLMHEQGKAIYNMLKYVEDDSDSEYDSDKEIEKLKGIADIEQIYKKLLNTFKRKYNLKGKQNKTMKCKIECLTDYDVPDYVEYLRMCIMIGEVPC